MVYYDEDVGKCKTVAVATVPQPISAQLAEIKALAMAFKLGTGKM